MRRKSSGQRSRPRASRLGRSARFTDWGARAVAFEAEGKRAEAEQAYLAAIEQRPESAAAWFNLGLLYKRTRRWPDALRCSQKAAELDASDQASWWNTAIAATALGEWSEARRAWRAAGIKVPDGEGPLDLSLGPVPIRLDPEGVGEVVWCKRLDPARAVIENVPLPASGHRYGDLLLHDGAPSGYRDIGGQAVPLFDEIEIIQPSTFSTYRVMVEAPTVADVDALRMLLEAADASLEDWSANLRALCRACSEGTPHEAHTVGRPLWTSSRELGVAVQDEVDLHAALSAWVTSGSGRSHGVAHRVVEGAVRH